MSSDSFRKKIAKLRNIVLLVNFSYLRLARRHAQIPVLPDLRSVIALVQIDGQAIPRQELMDAVKQGFLSREIAQGEELRNRSPVQPRFKARKLKEGFDF